MHRLNAEIDQNRGKNWIREAALACFFVSGASGLLYEVTWNRMLGLVFGNTVFATSTVLTSFMAGLALGSYISGRYADRLKKTLSAYAFLEIGIGIYCFLIPLLIKLLGGIYIPLQRSLQMPFYLFSLVRFILCFLLLLIPATFMGATTPVFSRFYVKSDEQFGHGIGRVYAINTFGAFSGVILSGFFMIEHLGVRNTINVGVAGNIAVAIACLLMDRTKAPSIEKKPKRRTKRSKARSKRPVRPATQGPEKWQLVPLALLIGFGVSGFAAMVYEVAWTRVLAMIIGSSIYAFSIMLATFLMGIALGSFIFSMVAKRKAVNLLWFGAAELIIGLAAVMTLLLFRRMPFYFISLFRMFGSNYTLLQLSKFLLCALVMIVPTVLLGSLFPMVSQICTRSYSELGRKIGTIYSVNTLGNIGGSFAAGFILIPYMGKMGIQNSVVLAAALNMVVGCVIILFHYALKLRFRVAISAGAATLGVLCILVVPAWKKDAKEVMKKIMTSGASVYAQGLALENDSRRRAKILGEDRELLFYKEGLEATIAVVKESKGTIAMSVNGKVDATNTGDMYTQLMVGHIPLLLHPGDPKSAMVIGLGSGVTLGAVAQYPLEVIDCAEIEPAVVEASEWFREENRNVLDDKRVNLVKTDGRNYLAVSQRKYDVIISEPSNLWLAGTVNLFSREYYQLCKERLNSDGMMIQWVHVYRMSEEDLKTVINTFRIVFPQTSIWYSIIGDIFMLGSNEKLVIDHAKLAERYYGIPGVKHDMERFYINIKVPLAILSCYLLGEKDVMSFAAEARINTDDKPILGFSTPRNLYLDTQMKNHELLLGYKSEEFPEVKDIKTTDWQKSSANLWYHLGKAYDSKGISNQAFRNYKRAISIDKNYAPAYVGLGLCRLDQGRTSDAIEYLKKAISLDPLDPDAYYNLAQIYEDQGLWNAAIYNYDHAIGLSLVKENKEKYSKELENLKYKLSRQDPHTR